MKFAFWRCFYLWKVFCEEGGLKVGILIKIMNIIAKDLI